MTETHPPYLDATNPDHYKTSSIECIDVMAEISLNSDGNLNGYETHLWLTAFKYLWRLCGKDTPLLNAKKARWYLDKLIESLENE
jgi:hypothetical protein